MLSNAKTKSTDFLRIVTILKSLRNKNLITEKEYNSAKSYYRKLIGADIVIID